MGIFDGILIVSDVDGTFLGKGGRLIEANLLALEAFRQEGGRFTFATGRLPSNLRAAVPMADSLVNAPGLMANGTCLYDFAAGRAVEEMFMDSEASLAVAALVAERYPDCGIRLSTPDGFLTNSLTGRVGRDLEKCAPDQVQVQPMETWKAQDWYKAVIRGEAERLDALRAEIEEKWPEAFTINKSHPTFLEFQRAGCTKATMLERLRAACTVNGKAPVIYAVGDYENDYAMLQAADVAVCPSNALPAVKEIADLCLASNDEGVIAALVAHIRKELAAKRIEENA